MKVQFVSKNKRRYVSIGKEFPNKKDPSQNIIEVNDELGKLLLLEQSGGEKLWKQIE